MKFSDETGAIIGSPRPLVAGEKVTVATGRFDLEGLFEARSGQDRVVLLVSMGTRGAGKRSAQRLGSLKFGTFACAEVRHHKHFEVGATAPILR